MGTILTMTITIDNYWLDLIIIKELYCARELSNTGNGDSVGVCNINDIGRKPCQPTPVTLHPPYSL